MCILVGMKSFPRFWRNHLYCRNRWSYEQAAFFIEMKQIEMSSKTSTFELDFKLVSNSCFGPHLRYLKTPKSQNMSSFIARDPQNWPNSHKNFFGGINSVYKAVGSIIDRTSCTCKASTKWKCSKVVYSIWVGQSEFFKGWSDCYWDLEVADTQIW